MSPPVTGQRCLNKTSLGVLCGIGAGALWGLVFLAPELVRSFTPLQLTIGRYLAFGGIAAALIAPRWRQLYARLSRRDWLSLGWLAMAGNTVYFILLSTAVQMGGIAMTSLIIGFLPVATTIIGCRDHSAVPVSRLIPSLLLCIAGALCIGWQALRVPASGSTTTQVVGLLCAVGALISWTAYAVGNSRCLARLEHLSAHNWNLLTGIVTGAQAVVLIPVAMLADPVHHDAAWLQFGTVCIGVAVFASMFGNALWNGMSRLLPLTLVGQMILFETLFALIYGFIWEQRLPTLLEAIAFLLLVLGVTSCLAVHRQGPPAQERPILP